MKQQIVKNALRTIKKQIGRFIALFVMSLLGVFVFAGLQATAPDMLTTIDDFLDSHQAYDIKILSTMGLTDDDIQAVCDLKEIEAGEGEKSVDVLFKINGQDETMRIAALPEKLNRLDLIDGRLPEKEHEIAVEENLLSRNKLQLGQPLTLKDENLKAQQFIIVGTVRSSQYYRTTNINQDRGTTTVGSGTLNYYAYIPKNGFVQDYYTCAYFTVKGASILQTDSDAYKACVAEAMEGIESIRSERENARKNQLKAPGEKAIDDGQAEMDRQIEDAQNQITNGYEMFGPACEQLNDGYAQLIEGRKELDAGWETYHSQLAEYGIEDIDPYALNDYLTKALSILDDLLDKIPPDSSLRAFGQMIRNKAAEIKSGIDQLISAEEGLKAAEVTYQEKLSELQSGISETISGGEQLLEGLDLMVSGQSDAEQQLDEARKTLAKVKAPQWLVYDRTEYDMYNEYINASDSIHNLSFVFPIVFFAVAVLISLVSMSRMVEDDRMEIGTLKSLGFANRLIMFKYLLFSGVATLFGSIAGAIAGLIFLPRIITNMYGMMFDLPSVILGANWGTTLIGIGLAFICVVGTTVLTVFKVVKEKPSVLMRPKAPKKGNRVLLEKLPFIWKHLNFSQKVSVRNMFRYKARALVMIIGIAGCTALILCGFGIKDSIVDIAKVQYEDLSAYDGMIMVNVEDGSSWQTLVDHAGIKNESATPVRVNQVTISHRNANLCIVRDNADIAKALRFRDIETKTPLSIQTGSCIITDKLAELENLHIGDVITVKDADNAEYELPVSGITEYYIEHYVFIDQATYASLGKTFTPNVIYFNADAETKDRQDQLSAQLMQSDNVINVSFITRFIDSVNDLLETLNKVIVILIVLASMLAFVVLYNLTNINIHERQREIATLKVLGFNNREVDSYIIKENIIMTVFGIVLGLIAGTYLAYLTVGTVELETMRFLRQVKWPSYCYSSGISILFTAMVSFATHFSLKKIDMIQSLKSVE